MKFNIKKWSGNPAELDDIIEQFRSISQNDFGVVWLLADFAVSNYKRDNEERGLFYYEALVKVCKEHLKKVSEE